jgi:Carboxypeptidase regulatory-like domain
MRIILPGLLAMQAALGHAPGQQPQPQRQPKATAVIRGRVTVADTSQPARRAQVRLNRQGGVPGGVVGGIVSGGYSATTDADGNYELAALLPGRYSVNVSKTGYVDQSTTGQPGSGRPPLEISEGQVVDHVDFTLVRGSVISGRIFDEVGDPISSRSPRFAEVPPPPISGSFRADGSRQPTISVSSDCSA